MRIPYCSFMSFSTSWAEGDTILYGVNVNKRYRLRVASALKKRRHRNKNPFRSLILSSQPEGKIHFWGHTISYHSPSAWLNVFIPVKSPHPKFFALWIQLFLTLWCKCSRPRARFCSHMWTIPILSPWCVFLQTCFHFLSFFRLSLFFPPLFFVHTQSAIIPPCRRGSGQ